MSSVRERIEGVRYLEECMAIIEDLKIAASFDVKGKAIGLDANVGGDSQTIRELIRIALERAWNFEIPSYIWSKERYEKACEAARLIEDGDLFRRFRTAASQRFSDIDIEDYV